MEDGENAGGLEPGLEGVAIRDAQGVLGEDAGAVGFEPGLDLDGVAKNRQDGKDYWLLVAAVKIGDQDDALQGNHETTDAEAARGNVVATIRAKFIHHISRQLFLKIHALQIPVTRSIRR